MHHLSYTSSRGTINATQSKHNRFPVASRIQSPAAVALDRLWRKSTYSLCFLNAKRLWTFDTKLHTTEITAVQAIKTHSILFIAVGFTRAQYRLEGDRFRLFYYAAVLIGCITGLARPSVCLSVYNSSRKKAYKN